MMKKNSITTYILIAIVLGAAVGSLCHQQVPDPKEAGAIAGYISIVTDLFLRMIKMIVAPLVFSTLVVGIAHMESASTVGRVGIKALGWFVTASFVSLLLGLTMATLLKPGANVGLPLPAIGTSTDLKTSAFTLKDFVTHVVPKSIVEAMANNEILQIVVFSIFFGSSLSALGELGKPLARLIDQIAQVMLKMTGSVMWLAPLAVFASIASIVTTRGLAILVTFAKFMGTFYLSLCVLWCLLILVGFLFLGRRVFSLVRLIRDPFLLAFSRVIVESGVQRERRELRRRWRFS